MTFVATNPGLSKIYQIFFCNDDLFPNLCHSIIFKSEFQNGLLKLIESFSELSKCGVGPKNQSKIFDP